MVTYSAALENSVKQLVIETKQLKMKMDKLEKDIHLFVKLTSLKDLRDTGLITVKEYNELLKASVVDLIAKDNLDVIERR